MTHFYHQLPVNLQSKAIDLTMIGTKSYAWKLEDITAIVEYLTSNGRIILGGDVLSQDSSGQLRYTYDNWYFEPQGNADDSEKSAQLAFAQSKSYLGRNDSDELLVDLVVARTE